MIPSILLVDDEPAILLLLSHYLRESGYNVKEAACLAEAREAIQLQQFNAVILDLKLPDGNGIDWITDLRKISQDVAIIVVTGGGDIPVAVEAMRRGADNFLTKPVNISDLDIFLQKSIEIQRLRKIDLTSKKLQKKVQFFFGKAKSMQEVREQAIMAAEHSLPVLIQGETGTGKSLLAKWIHEQSHRHAAPFVEVSCSSLSGELLASELFGHVKGAFTSAIQDKEGLIEVSDGGTLFLDEIGDMALSIQAQFLKVIEEKRYRRLGEVKVRQSDFRLICATNKNLQKEKDHGRFREDLFFRINIFPIYIAPLRERLDDMMDLVQHIITNFGSKNIEVSSKVMSLFKSYPWKGNVRELKNLLERALFLAHGNPLSIEHFRGLEIPALPSDGQQPSDDIEQWEEEHIKTVINRSGGNIRKAAVTLGISKSALYRKLNKFRKPL